jgi:amidohydrolase
MATLPGDERTCESRHNRILIYSSFSLLTAFLVMSDPVQHIRRFHAELAEIRRDLHAHPELAFEENRTSSVVAEKLSGWGIEVHRGLAKTGVVGVIKGRRSSSGRAVGLRADMDCLPMQETGSVAYRSRHDGRMHACGHDGHTTMLLGAARYLAETRNFDGTAYLIFQPAEEGGGGGAVMVNEGLFERFPANEVYALHNWPGLAPGRIAVRAGPMMAATDEIQITVRGRGGNAAMPHLVVDPVVACAHIITALQTIASRNVNPVDAVVVSVCSMQTSQVGAFNVVPEAVKLLGTVRSFRPETRELAERRVKEIVTKAAEAFGASAAIDYRRGYPATVNSAREAEFAARVGERIFGRGAVITDADPTMGGEDFSYMLQQRPGAYVWLGQGGGAGGCFLHNPGYDFNDEVIPLGAGYLAALVEDALPLE